MLCATVSEVCVWRGKQPWTSSRPNLNCQLQWRYDPPCDFPTWEVGALALPAQPYLTTSRRSSGDKLSPLAALTTWYQKHGKNLHPESQTHLEQLIREHSGNAVPLQTPQQETQEHSPAEEEASQWPENISQPIPSSKDVKRDMQGATPQTPASLSSSPPCHLIRCLSLES